MIKKIIFTLLSLYSFSCIQAKEIVKDFTAATITLEFPVGGSGSTKDKIIEYVSQDPVPPATENETTIQKATIHVLVPHHSQRIYDDPNDLKYEYTINYVAKDGWELEKVPVKADSPYEVNKMESADKIADATKETIYTLNLRKKIVEESNQSEDNSAEAKYQKAEYKIILYTPSIHLTLHAPGTTEANGEKMKRPLTEEADTVEGFDTGYLGVLLRNEDNDDGDHIASPDLIIIPRDNDDDKPSETDDDLVALLLEMKIPSDMPYELKMMVKVDLSFEKSKEKHIQVFDEDKTKVSLAKLSAPIMLGDPGADKHLSKLIKDGSATIYLEGLGVTPISLPTNGWGDEIDQITLQLTSKDEYKEGRSHGLLMLADFKDYFGGSVFVERETPKCCGEKKKKQMLTHLYPDKGSERCAYLQNGDTLDVSLRLPVFPSIKYELVYESLGDVVERKEIEGSDDIQIIKYDPNKLDLATRLIAIRGIEVNIYLLIKHNDLELLKSPKLNFLVDNAQVRNQLFKVKIDPFSGGWQGKGSTGELLMGIMLHEVSKEIIALVEKNTINHTKDPDFHLHDPRATQGTNREIINGLAAQIGKLGSEWDKAADHALKVEQIANKKAQEQIILFLDFDGAKKTMVDAIFHDAFNEFEKIENKIRGFGWGKYGCPCDGDDKILSETSLRGVNSPEVLKMMASYSPAAATGLALLPRSFIENTMIEIQSSKINDLKNNFAESWKIGGCCN